MDFTRLLLVRHGETAWNAVGRVQGQLDVPLSPKGVWQAGSLAQHLAQRREIEPIDAVISSPLARAWLTAQTVAQALGLELQVDARLSERAFGIFEGHTLEEISARWPMEFAQWRARDAQWVIPQGESGEQFIQRSLAGLRDCSQRWAGKTLVLVVHGGVLDVAYRHAHGLTWDAPRQHLMLNTAINRMRAAHAPWSLEMMEWGDVSHLDTDQMGPALEGSAP